MSYMSDAERAQRLLDADFDFKQLPKTDSGPVTPMDKVSSSILRA